MLAGQPDFSAPLTERHLRRGDTKARIPYKRWNVPETKSGGVGAKTGPISTSEYYDLTGRTGLETQEQTGSKSGPKCEAKRAKRAARRPEEGAKLPIRQGGPGRGGPMLHWLCGWADPQTPSVWPC